MTIQTTDIHKIIDDAIEKKDRCVSIFISGVGTTITISPNEEIPSWIEVRGDHSLEYKCPTCGSVNERPTVYCPYCGDRVKIKV